jgi:pescadillo protein
MDTFEEQAEGGDAVPGAADLAQAASEADRHGRLFDGCVFFLSREVPRYSLEFVIRAFGGRVSWEGIGDEGCGEYAADSKSITHHIVDRPALSTTFDGRHYIQPQWVYDCVNAQALLPTANYTIGAVLPPHLSPFVEESEDDYMPPERKAQLAAAKSIHAADMALEAANGEEGEEEEEDTEEVYREELEAELRGEDATAEAQDEGESGAPAAKRVKGGKKKQKSKAEAAKEEAHERKELAKLMMPRKDRKLYSRIMHGKKKKQREAAELVARRQAIDSAKGGNKRAK